MYMKNSKETFTANKEKRKKKIEEKCSPLLHLQGYHPHLHLHISWSQTENEVVVEFLTLELLFFFKLLPPPRSKLNSCFQLWPSFDVPLRNVPLQWKLLLLKLTFPVLLCTSNESCRRTTKEKEKKNNPKKNTQHTTIK